MNYKDFEKKYKTEVIKMHKTGKRPKVIAYELKIEVNHVYYLLNKFKMYSQKKRTPEQSLALAKEIFKLRTIDPSSVSIGKALGVSKHLVNLYIRKYKDNKEVWA